MQIAMQIAELQGMSLAQLQTKWSDYFDTPPFSQNKEFYVSRIAYRIQELAYGGIPYEQQQFIAKMYVEPKKRVESIPTGTRITREYSGVERELGAAEIKLRPVGKKECGLVGLCH